MNPRENSFSGIGVFDKSNSTSEKLTGEGGGLRGDVSILESKVVRFSSFVYLTPSISMKETAGEVVTVGGEGGGVGGGVGGEGVEGVVETMGGAGEAGRAGGAMIVREEESEEDGDETTGSESDAVDPAIRAASIPGAEGLSISPKFLAKSAQPRCLE
jgi:hypothetical protein